MSGQKCLLSDVTFVETGVHGLAYRGIHPRVLSETCMKVLYAVAFLNVWMEPEAVCTFFRNKRSSLGRPEPQRRQQKAMALQVMNPTSPSRT